MPPQQRKKSAEPAGAVAPEPDPEESTETPQVKPEPDPEDKPEEKGGHSLLNPGNTTITYTEDGKQLDAGQSVEVEELDDVAKTAIERGYLIEN